MYSLMSFVHFRLISEGYCPTFGRVSKRGRLVLGIILQGMGIGVALAAPIGPINIEIIRRGLQGGFTRGWLVGLGAVTADTIYCAIIIGGFAPIADNVWLRIPLYLAGALVLGYLGLGGIRSAFSSQTASAAPPTGRRSYAAGFMMAATNPMGIVYWLSIGSALVASAVERSGQGAAPSLLLGVFSGIVVWVTVLSLMAFGGRRFVSPTIMRWLTGLSGAVLAGFGVWFGYQGVQALLSV